MKQINQNTTMTKAKIDFRVKTQLKARSTIKKEPDFNSITDNVKQINKKNIDEKINVNDILFDKLIDVQACAKYISGEIKSIDETLYKKPKDDELYNDDIFQKYSPEEISNYFNSMPM